MGRTERRTESVPVTRNGETFDVPRTYVVPKAVPPRDWDMIALHTVFGAVTLAVLGAMAWSTMAIGDLLALSAPVWVAYTVAGVFDLAWVVCMVLEWLCRYDPARAKAPRVAGWFALAVSMALIFTDSQLKGLWIVGLCGALVSAVVKSVWSLVMGHTAVKLPQDDQDWLTAKRGSGQTRLAMAAQERRLARVEARTALYRTEPDLKTESAISVLSQERAQAIEAAGGVDAEPVSRYPVGHMALNGNVHLGPQDTCKDTVCTGVLAVRDMSQDTGQDTGQDRTPRPRTVDGTRSVSSFVLSLLKDTPDMPRDMIRKAVRDALSPDTTDSAIDKAVTRAKARLRQAA